MARRRRAGGRRRRRSLGGLASGDVFDFSSPYRPGASNVPWGLIGAAAVAYYYLRRPQTVAVAGLGWVPPGIFKKLKQSVVSPVVRNDSTLPVATTVSPLKFGWNKWRR